MKQQADAPPDPGPIPGVRFTREEADMLFRAISDECDRRINAALDRNGESPGISAALMLEICDRILITQFGWKHPADGDTSGAIARFNAAVMKEIRTACLEDRIGTQAPGNSAGGLLQNRKRPCPE